MRKNINHRQNAVNKSKKRPPLSAIILVVLLLSTFLTVLVAEQAQENRSKAQQNQPIQQACLPDTNLTQQEASKIEPFCTQFSEATTCKDFCKRTSDASGNSSSSLCKPGGIFHCETGSGQTEKGKCQQGACTTSPVTGNNNYCGGGQTCCKPPQPVGGECAKKEDCVTGLECTANKCAAPAPKGPAQDLDGDGKQNDQDDDIDGDGIPNAQDPDADNDGQPNQQDEQPIGAPGAPPVANPAPRAPAGRTTCASVGGTCKARSACTGTVRTGLCSGASNICCIGGTTGCTSDAQCKARNANFVCQNGTCRAPSTCIATGKTTTSSSACCSGLSKSYLGSLYCD